MSTARQYELVYIVTPEASEQEIADLHTQIEQIVQRYNGTFDKTENWGRKRMAYDIGRHREGNYVVETITGSGELMKEIDRRLRVIDSVIRHLIVRVDEELRVAQRTTDARKTFVARRRRKNPRLGASAPLPSFLSLSRPRPPPPRSSLIAGPPLRPCRPGCRRRPCLHQAGVPAAGRAPLAAVRRTSCAHPSSAAPPAVPRRPARSCDG